MNHLTSQLRAHRAKGQKGFTLIELLVVIVILGILAAVVVFSVGGITDRGKKSACDATKKTLRTASEAYRAQNDAIAPSLFALREFAKDVPTIGNIFGTDGGDLTYDPSTGNVTGTCSI